MMGLRPHDVFFCAAVFFLSGVFLESIGWKARVVVVFLEAAITLVVLFFILGEKRFLGIAFIAPLLLLGALFYVHYQVSFLQTAYGLPFNREAEISGVVSSDPQLKGLQEFKVRLVSPFQGQILVRAARYPRVKYGDEVDLTGRITKPKGNYELYLIKEKVSGIITYPRLHIAETGNWSLRRTLFSARSRALSVFQRALPYEEAAFLGGITLGSREALSDKLKEAMALSGTTHLVALSGYNITIIVAAGSAVLAGMLSRKKTFLVLILLITGFVVMTGAEASVVRAATMGALVVLAPVAGRIYAPRNSIALAALAMTLENPNVIAYDIGFQLSFLALFGIIHLRPIIKKILRFGEDEGLFAWKNNLVTTVSAQIAVSPILLITFGRFTITSVFANLLILGVIPITMFLGFVLAGAGFFSYTISLIVGWLTLFLLKFEVAVIYFFSKFSFIIKT